MKCYFAGYSTQPEIRDFTQNASKNLLETYHYFKNKDYRAWHKENNLMGRELFLDSGAFSAFTLGVKIDIDKYIEFIKKYEDMITAYATLDVIGDYKATDKNTKYMQSKGLKPIPTFHYGSPYEELERLVNEYDYIALGGLVPIAKDRPKMQAHLDKCFSIIKTKTRVHGFGVNGLWAWIRYPFYSVDATSWLMGGKFRQVIKFNPKKLKFETSSKTKLIDAHNFRLAHDGHYKELNMNNAIEYKKAADFVTKLWKNRGVDWLQWEKDRGIK